MSNEFTALVRNGTWERVPPSPSQNLIGWKWVFGIKRKPDGSVDRYKVRLVAKFFTNARALTTPKPLVLWSSLSRFELCLHLPSLTASWPLRQLDVL